MECDFSTGLLKLRALRCTLLALGMMVTGGSWAHAVESVLPERGVGSATLLTGQVCLYHIYVTDDHSQWSMAGINQVVQRLNRATHFLTSEAARYDVELSFEHRTAQRVHYAGEIPMAVDADPAWTEQVVQLAAGTTSSALIDSLREELQVESVLILLHVNKPAISYNLVYAPSYLGRYPVERAVCFTQYDDRRPTCEASYAHEILHGFGAIDLYYPFEQEMNRKQMAARLFPDDIMLRVDYDLSALTVDELTAYCIGWQPGLRTPLLPLIE